MNSSSFLTGFALSASLIVAIGAQNAFVLCQGLRRVGAVVLFCALGDVVLMSAGVLGLGSALQRWPMLTQALTGFGALFLLAYGALALQRASRPGVLRAAGGDTVLPLRAVLAQAAGFTLLNPHVYLDAILLMGSLGARLPGAAQPWFLGGGAAASGVWFGALGFGARLLRPWFARPSAWRVLDLLVGLTMCGLAAMLARSLISG